MSSARDSDDVYPPLAGNPGVEFRGVRYAYLIASDVERDGISLELWRRDEPNEMVAEIHSADDGTFAIRLFDSLPMELVEDAIATAKRNFSPGDEPPRDQT